MRENSAAKVVVSPMMKDMGIPVLAKAILLISTESRGFFATVVIPSIS